MTVTIYHNPRCSKSRKTLELIARSGVEPTVVEYLASPPDAAKLRVLARMLGLRMADLLRRGEAAFRDATDRPALDNDEALAEWLARHPAALQRPIVVDERRGKAIIGRPPENVLELLPR